MAKKNNMSLLIESFQEGQFLAFYDNYNKFKEKAIKNGESYRELREQFPSNLSEKNLKPWQNSFITCMDFVEICSGLQTAKITEERLKRKKSDVISHIVKMLKGNMAVYSEEEARPKEAFFTILVYTDILTAFSSNEDKFMYLAIFWDLLRQIDSNLDAQTFYGDTGKEVFLKRSKSNLKECSIGEKEIQERLRLETKEYICRYLQALNECMEKEHAVERNVAVKKSKKVSIYQILLPVGCVLILVIGFVVMGISNKKQVEDSKEYKTLKVQYEKVLEENQDLLQEKDDLEKQKKTLEQEIEKLQEKLLEQQENEGEILVLKEVCELRKEANESSFLVQMLQPEVEVTILENLGDGWLKVKYQGEIGYIHYLLAANE